MTITNYDVEINDDYVSPTEPILTNDEYVDFVMNMAAQSYMKQYNTDNYDDGITAAREAYNAALPPPAPMVEEAPVEETPVAV